MRRIAEYKRIDTRIEKRIVHRDIYDEETGEITGCFDEEVDVEVPVMGMVYRDATPEEEAEAKAEQERIEAEEAMREPTIEERMTRSEERTDVLEATTDDVILMMAELIGG